MIAFISQVLSMKNKLRKYFKLLLILFLSLILSVGCNKSDNRTFNAGFEYYPIVAGHYITYSVDSFYYSSTNYPQIRIDTIHYEIKELIDTSFLDNAGRTSYRIERYRRPDAYSNWSIDRIWSVNNNNIVLDKNEDDLHFIKLVFPIVEGKTWKGNRQIAAIDEHMYLKDWIYQYQDIDQSYTIGMEVFDSTLLVMQVNVENLIEKKFAYERYAKGIGMISKEIKFLGKQRDLTNGWGYPETGVWVRYEYTGSGQE